MHFWLQVCGATAHLHCAARSAGASVQTAHIAEAIHLRSAAKSGVTRGTRLAYVAWKDEMRQPRQGWYLQNAA